MAFTGDPHPFGKPAAKCLAYHFFCLTVAIARREIEEINPGSDRVMYGRDAFVERCFTPHHADAAAAQRQRRDRPKLTEAVLPHECRLRDTDHNSQQA